MNRTLFKSAGLVLPKLRPRNVCKLCLRSSPNRAPLIGFVSPCSTATRAKEVEDDIENNTSECGAAILEEEDSFEIKTEIDQLWFKKITSKYLERQKEELSSMGDVKDKQAIERYELDCLVDVYKEIKPDMDEGDLKKLHLHVDELTRKAYQDRAPPEMSIEEFESYIEYKEIELKYEETEKNQLPPVVDRSSSYSARFANHQPRDNSEKYLMFLFKTYWKRASESKHDAKKKEAFENRPVPDNATWLTSLTKSYQRIFKNHGKNRLVAACRLGNPVVLDMSYGHLMSNHETKEMAKQITLMANFLMKIPEPFHLHLTNFDKSSEVAKELEKRGSPYDSISLTTTPLSFIDIFPRSQLVYLSPDATPDLEEFDPDDIYVLGGLVDRRILKDASLLQAKNYKVRVAKFPFKQNARVMSAKPLNFIEVLNILNRFTTHGDIHRALCEGVSKRRLIPPEDADDIVRRKLDKARRLIGERGFVEREIAFAQKRFEIVQRMNNLDQKYLRQKSFEPHENTSWLT